MCMCNTHTTCAFFAFTGCSAWIFYSPCLKADQTPGNIYALTSANFAQISQKALWDNLNSRIALLWVVSKKANKKHFFSFLEHRELWTFWESLWTSIKCDLFNVWICRRRGSQINWANVEMDLLPTPLQCNHISLSTSVDNYWIRHSKRWLTNRNQANKDNLPFF